MHTFLDNFHQGGKYPVQIASHQAELRREGNFTDQKSLNISYLQTNYLNIDSSSGFGKDSQREKNVHTKCTFCGGTNHSAEKCFKRIRQEKEKSRAAGALDNRRTERTSQECFRCGYEDHLIEKCPKPPKYNKKRRKQVRFNEKVNHACDNSKNTSDQKIYAPMSRMSGNDEYLSGNFGDISQLTNWILDSGATCHMKPEV